MLTSLQIGCDRSVSLDLPPGAVLAGSGRREMSSLDNPVAAVQAAFDEPLSFPPLRDMVLSDDLVAIALQPGLPCAAELVAGTVLSLLDAGVPPELIQIVRAAGDHAVSDRRLLDALDTSVADRIAVLHHDPGNREHLSFLGASKGGHAIYVNRVLCDAAVVIPVGSHLRLNDVGCLGVHQGWFPVLADADTQGRFNTSMCAISDRKTANRRMECTEAAWMLGVQMMVRLVPAGDDRALHVVAGTPEAVWERTNALATEAWRMPVDRRASLVVAAIGGGPEQQTWDNLVRSIDAALDVVEVDGAIAICSQLKSLPGPGLRKLAAAEDFESADRAIRRRPSDDALTASRLNQALQRSRVYLLSELDEGVVEDMGMAYVSNEAELSQLLTHHETCLVVENAQHVSMTLPQGADLD